MMLNITNLGAGYGRIPILAGIGFSVDEGECVGLWGHNGMGKTTLLRAIMGYLAADAGTISFSGTDITRLPTHARVHLGIGLVPQGRQIFPGLTVLENLRMGNAALAAADGYIMGEVLELFPRLKPLLDRKGGNLSGGEQQLLALARCLCGRPRMILLDEPTEGIQPSINDEIVETLQLLRTKWKLTMVIVEQKRDFIASLASRALIMQKGTITKEVPAIELLDHDDFH
jgi:branched-chain amino acid transport system ATP-binding protein